MSTQERDNSATTTCITGPWDATQLIRQYAAEQGQTISAAYWEAMAESKALQQWYGDADEWRSLCLDRRTYARKAE